jgi:hypothetical protein
MVERSQYKTDMPLMRPNQRGRPIDPALYYAKSMLAQIAQVHFFARNKRVEEMDWER